MTYDGGTLTISMPMMSATIWMMVVVQEVPHGTYLEKRGKDGISWKLGEMLVSRSGCHQDPDDVIRGGWTMDRRNNRKDQ